MNIIDKLIKEKNIDGSPEYVKKIIETVAIVPENNEFIIKELFNNNISWEDIEVGEESKIAKSIDDLMTFDSKHGTNISLLNKYKNAYQVEKMAENANNFSDYFYFYSKEDSPNTIEEQLFNSTCLYHNDGSIIVCPHTSIANNYWNKDSKYIQDDFHRLGADIFIYKNKDNNIFNFYKGGNLLDSKGNNFYVNDLESDKNLILLSLLTGNLPDNFNLLSDKNIKEYSHLYPDFIKNTNSLSSEDYKAIIKAKLPNHVDIVKELFKSNNSIKNASLRFLSKKDENYKELALFSVKANPRTISFVDSKNPDYKEMVETAVRNGLSVTRVDEEKYGKKDKLWEITTRYDDFDLIPKDLPNINKVNENFVKQNGLLISSIPSSVSNYEEIIKNAIDNNPFVLDSIDKSFITDDLIERAIKKNGNVISIIPKDNPKYNELAKIAVASSPEAIDYIPNDKEGLDKNELRKISMGLTPIAMKVLFNRFMTSSFYNNSSDELKEIVKYGIEKHPEGIKYISMGVFNYYELAKISVEANPKNIKYVKMPFLNKSNEKKYYEIIKLAFDKDASLVNDDISKNLSNFTKFNSNVTPKMLIEFLSNLPHDNIKINHSKNDYFKKLINHKPLLNNKKEKSLDI